MKSIGLIGLIVFIGLIGFIGLLGLIGIIGFIGLLGLIGLRGLGLSGFFLKLNCSLAPKEALAFCFQGLGLRGFRGVTVDGQNPAWPIIRNIP